MALTPVEPQTVSGGIDMPSGTGGDHACAPSRLSTGNAADGTDRGAEENRHEISLPFVPDTQCVSRIGMRRLLATAAALAPVSEAAVPTASNFVPLTSRAPARCPRAKPSLPGCTWCECEKEKSAQDNSVRRWGWDW